MTIEPAFPTEPKPPPPRMSVIVCTHNRAAALRSCLASVARAAQAEGTSETEVLVVDNNCTDDTQAVIREAVAEHPDLTLRSVAEPRTGLSHARNRGLAEATGDLLIMIDDDCLMERHYMSRVLEHDARDTAPALRGGSVLLGDPTDQPLTIKTDPVPKSWTLAEGSARHENLGNSLYGCNMVMRRELTERVGPFDTKLGAGSSIPGGEDTDYVFRAYLAGYKVDYAPDLVVRHFHGRKRVEDGYELFRNYSIGGGALYAKYMFTHPNMCRQLYWDIKSVAKEWIRRTNLFVPEFNFSMTDKVRFSVLGMIYYGYSLLAR